MKMDPTRLSPTTDLHYVTSQKNEGPRSWVVTNTEEIVFRTKRDDGVMFPEELLEDEALKPKAVVTVCCTKDGSTDVSRCLSKCDVVVSAYFVVSHFVPAIARITYNLICVYIWK